jgi:hypothetical protein
MQRNQSRWTFRFRAPVGRGFGDAVLAAQDRCRPSIMNRLVHRTFAADQRIHRLNNDADDQDLPSRWLETAAAKSISFHLVRLLDLRASSNGAQAPPFTNTALARWNTDNPLANLAGVIRT